MADNPFMSIINANLPQCRSSGSIRSNPPDNRVDAGRLAAQTAQLAERTVELSTRFSEILKQYAEIR
jgi:hypothetical protein